MTLRTDSLILVAILFLTVSGAETIAQDKYRLKPGATGELCLSCHVDFQDVVALPSVHTPVKAGNCADCHDPHASDHGRLLADDPDAICVTCHDDIVPEGAMSSHQLALEGQCVQCHDPHASNFPNALRLDANELCLDCHEDLASAIESATYGHAPVEKDCLGCHTPHASEQAPALLSESIPALCVECHDPSRERFARDHVGYSVGESDCTSCHDPHGSSNRGILWASVHSPLSRRMCSQCHPDATAPNALEAKRPGADLCRGCHNDLFNETFSKNRIHWPVVDQRACGNCHRPHASKVASLLSAPEGELCGNCHQDTVRRQASSLDKHEPIADGQCAACHAPHASNTTFLLASSNTTELCGICHDWENHSTHPMGEKVFDQRNRNLVVDCLSCHRTHGTQNEKLTHFEPDRDLCTQCHTSYTR